MLRTEWPLAVVGAVALVGLLLVAAGVGGFRLGATLVGSSLMLGALLRAGLPEQRAGLLAVRSRAYDVVLLLCLGAGVVVLAGLVPVGR